MVTTFKWLNYFKDATMKIYSYIYSLRKLQNNQERAMISYAILIYSENFHKPLNDSTNFQNLLKASIGMKNKILGNSGLFKKLPWQYIFNF